MAAKFPEEDIADESSIKGEESHSNNDDAPSEAQIHDNLLQLTTETPWKKVEKRQKGTRTYEPSSAPQTRGGRGQHSTSRGGRAQRGRGHDRGPKPTRGRSGVLLSKLDKHDCVDQLYCFHSSNFSEPSNAQQTGGGRGGRAQRGRGHDRRPTRGRGNGVFSRSSDRNGYILKDVRYERNKLYVLGLHHRVTKECLLHYIEKISNYDVKHILWFKPNGRAIVTLDPETIDFQRICREAQKRPLTLNKERKDDVSDVLIERAPVCKSIFVRGIPLNTPEEEIENHFEKLGIVEKFCFNTKEVKERRAKEMRAIVYFKSEKSVKKIVDNDNFLDGTLLAVERYYPFMGTVEPVDSKIPQYTESKIPLCEGPYFRMVVDQDTIEFVMSKSNRGLELQEKLSAERANINWTNKDGYVLVKYNSKGHKRDNEFDDQDWEERCRHILSDLLDRFTLKDIPVEKEIWKQVINELPQIESLFPNYSAQIKKLDDLEELRLICLKTDMPEFEKKLLNRIEEVKQAELEKTLEHKTLTNFPIVILKLMEMVGIQSILKENVHQDIQTRIELAQKSIFIKTPQGQMSAAVAYLREREKEVKQNSTQSPPEIIGILKTKVGKRKLNTEFKESNLHCTFNIDESNNKILFLGRAPEDTVRGRKVAEATLITGRLHIKDRDNDILQSDEWKQICRNFEKRSKVRCQRGSVTEFHVFGFKKGVDEVVKALTKFLNEKKAKEGEFRFNSPVHQRLFREFYKDEITKLEESLSLYSVKISWEENGDMHFTGAVEGVKEVTNKLNAMQDDITEETCKVILPGMRSFLAKNKEEVVGVVEKENECVIEIQECMGEWQDPDDFDEISSISSEEEAFDEDDYTIVTQEGKKIIWKIGRIEEEEAGVLVCSVGSNLKLSIGAVARAFNETGGPALQRALNETGIRYLDPGKVLRVHLPLKAGKLACDHVVFCVCCPWSDGKTAAKQTLQGLMRNCFDATSEVGCGSIALPLIGTGNLDFPHDVAVQVMVDEALSYSKTFPNSPIEELRFIVYEKDQEGISGFEDKFKHFKDDPQRTFPLQKKPSIGQLSGKRKKTPPSSESKCAKVYIGDVLLEVVKGDITEQRTDGIINVVRKDMQMTTGKLSAAILEVCGEEVQEELSKYYPQPLGSVVTTSAGKLKVHWIIHMVVGSGKRQHLLKCIQEALKEARNKGLKTISIPAIGSGGLGLSPQDSAEVVIGSLQEVYLGTIRSIRIVVIEDSVINVYERKLKLMKAELRCTPGYTELDDDEEGGADATSMSWCYHHNVTVYGRNKRLAEAIASLKDKVIRECPPTDITEDVIERLSSRCRRHLRRKAREEDVGLDFSKPGTITLTGFSTDVIKMHTEVTKVLQEQLKNEHLMERAEIMSRNVQWCFLAADGKNEPFEKMANYEIETAQQSNEPSVYFAHRKSQAEIVFAQDNVTFNITGAVRKVIRKDVLPLPKNWDCHPLDAKKRKVKVHPVRLDADSPEYKDVNEKFMRSISENICVTSIQRIQNPSMYRSYATKRQSMDEKNGNHKNEWYLFHGTAYRNVKDINAHGLNRSFCGRNGATYGDGVYFATESSYSLSFSKPPNSKGECCMYLAKVLAGKYADGEKGMRQPPPIDQERPDLRFDSVVDTSNDPTIFVIFHDDQCYPEYLITFTRPADGYAAT